MICGACLAIPIVAIGISLSFTDKFVIGLLLTILSLCIYLHFKEIKECEQCNKKCTEEKCLQ
jgi:hypothetical protein